MKIRAKLTYQFSVIIISTVFTLSVIIFIISSEYRKNQFFSRLEDKAQTTSKLLFEVAQVDSVLLKIIEAADQTVLYNEKVVIVDTANNIIFDTREEVNFYLDNDTYNKIREKKKHKGRIKNIEYYAFTYYDKNEEFLVVASAYDYFGFKKIKNLSNVLIISFFIVVFISLYFGWFFSGRALRPVSKMIGEVRSLTSKNLNKRLDISNNKDELAELANTFNKMLDELELAFNIQKEFVSNASHELKTPLTAIKSQIDVALLKERNTQEYFDILHSVKEDISALSNIINNLLLLAQTSVNIFSFTFVDARIDEVIWKAQQILMDKNKSYNIIIDFRNMPEDINDLNINCNYVLLRNVFVNLMDNGCKYSADNSVKVSIAYNKDFFEIIFTDNGIGIKNEDLKNIVKPFFRGQNVAGKEGHGIGLALVNNIINIHKGKLEFFSQLGKGTTVIVKIPKREII